MLRKHEISTSIPITKPLAVWKQKVNEKKQAKQEAEDKLRQAEEAAKEARWIGVPAWKRTIIEKKEAALNGGDGQSP